MSKIFFDTETCGLHGPIVLLQYAVDDGPVTLYEPWREPVWRTLELIDWIMANTIVGFNLTFDHFHMCQMYTTLTLYADQYPNDCDDWPDPEKYANLEPLARDLGCLKPAGASDVYLTAKKTKYQSLMDRKDIIIRKVPGRIAKVVADELNKRVPFKPIYFARKKTPGPVWTIQECKRSEGFCNIVCRFKPSSRLKALAKDALNLEDDPVLLKDIAMEPWQYPIELGYAPFALALRNYAKVFGPWEGTNKKFFTPGDWYHAWPSVISHHIGYWRFFDRARDYAKNDVEYTRQLYYHFGVEPNDDDSVLACLVGAVRWKGFAIDTGAIEDLKREAIASRAKIPTDPAGTRRYITAVCSPTEAICLSESTAKDVLEEIVKWRSAECEWCGGEGCELCPPHDASIRAKEVLDARHADKRIQLYNKLLVAGRLHASMQIIGTKSTRMSGDNDLNVHAINKIKKVRKSFPLAFPPYQLNGGDFDAFEVAIAAAHYNDPLLYRDLQAIVACPFCNGTGHELWQDSQKPKENQDGSFVSCDKCNGSGKEKQKIHAIFGTFVFPGKTYVDIRKSAGTEDDMYTRAKSGLFTWLYAGTEYSFEKRLGIPKDHAKNGLEAFGRAYPEIGKKRDAVMIDYRPVTQPDGTGTAVLWHEHKDSVKTLLGFTRYFILEYEVVRALYDLATNPPKEWQDVKGVVVRRNFAQSLAGATQSAIYGALFALQNHIARAAINHPIQGTGAEITKNVERELWEIQPVGYHEWIVIPLNVHDEIMSAVHPDYIDPVTTIINRTVSKHRALVPLLKFDWHKGMTTWADK
jgi:hypothetical protein